MKTLEEIRTQREENAKTIKELKAKAETARAEWKRIPALERIKYIKGKLEYLDGLQDQKTLSKQEVVSYIMKDKDLNRKSPEDLKHIVQTYVERVVIFEDKIEIHLIINKNNPGSKCHPDCGYDGGDDFFRFITTIELLKYRHKQL